VQAQRLAGRDLHVDLERAVRSIRLARHDRPLTRWPEYAASMAQSPCPVGNRQGKYQSSCDF
jgi:hypothetical protein